METRTWIFGIGSQKPLPAPHPDGTGIKMTPFGKEINGVPETLINHIHDRARKSLFDMDRQNWDDIATKCWKLARIDKPRLRALMASIWFGGLHESDPADLEEYAEATGNSVIDAADELSSVGGFEEKPYGIITGEIHWDSDDLPEDDGDDDGDESLEIGSVEA